MIRVSQGTKNVPYVGHRDFFVIYLLQALKNLHDFERPHDHCHQRAPQSLISQKADANMLGGSELFFGVYYTLN